MKVWIPIILFLATAAVGAQESPRAALIDEFGAISCDEMLARIDNFFIQIHNNPTAKGWVMISGSNEHLVKKIKLETLFTSGVIQRRYEPKNVTILRGPEIGEAKMQFGLAAEVGDRVESVWNLAIPKGTKPSYFLSDSDTICIYPTVYKYLRELLQANPRLRINAVVWEKNSRKYRKKVKDVRESLGANNSRRLSFFQKHEPFDASTEFWLVP